MQYRYSNTDNIANGQANYLIIGLGGNSSQQGLRPVAPMPTPLPSSTPISTPSSTPAVTPTPSRQIHVGWQLQQEICKYYPNTEVIYGCPEEPTGCYLPSHVGDQGQSISDCYTGTGGMTRCTRQWLCVEY